jgi:hypothetical protein
MREPDSEQTAFAYIDEPRFGEIVDPRKMFGAGVARP